MAWVRIDDRFTENPKVLTAGPLAIAMQVAGLCYCNRELTDGFIPRSKARSLLDWEFVRDEKIFQIGVASGMAGSDVDCQCVIDILVDAGMWEVVDGGYQIHDYEDYQPSKAQVLAERESSARRQAEFRSRNKESNAVTNGVTNGPVTVAPVPVPVSSNELIDTPPVSPSPGEKPKPVRSVKTPIPENIVEIIPGETWAAIGAEQKLTDDQLRYESALMVDHYRGKGERRPDWVATWRNWMRSEYRKSKPTAVNGVIDWKSATPEQKETYRQTREREMLRQL